MITSNLKYYFKIISCLLALYQAQLHCVQIREYHRRHPAARVVDVNEDDGLLKEEPQIEFSGEVSLFLFMTEICIELLDCSSFMVNTVVFHKTGLLPGHIWETSLEITPITPSPIMKIILMLAFSYCMSTQSILMKEGLFLLPSNREHKFLIINAIYKFTNLHIWKKVN